MLENGHWMQGNIRPFFIFAIFASLSVSDFKNGQISMSQIISLFKAQLLFGWIEDRMKSFTSEEGQINTGRKITV